MANVPLKSAGNELKVFLHVTNQCNLRCVHCCVDSRQKLGNELGAAEIGRFVDELARMGATRINFTGGEPLMREDIFELIEYAAGKGMEVRLETNGSLLTKEKIARLKSAGLDLLTVSLDGSRRGTHDSFRGRAGLFDTVVREIRNAMAAGLDTTVSFCVSKHNIGEAMGMPELLAGVGVRKMSYLFFTPIGRGAINAALTIGNDKWLDFRRRIEIKRQQMKDRISIRYALSILTPDEASGRLGKEMEWCTLVEPNTPTIAPNGDVYPCVLLMGNKQSCLGNIRDESFSKIWNPSRIAAIREGGDRNERCLGCRHAPKCAPGCIALAASSAEGIDQRCDGKNVPVCPCTLHPQKW